MMGEVRHRGESQTASRTFDGMQAAKNLVQALFGGRFTLKRKQARLGSIQAVQTLAEKLS